MTDKPIFCCPICTTPLNYEDRILQHLRNSHGKQQMSYQLLEDAPINFLVVNKQGLIYQKASNTEQCWMTPNSVVRLSSWTLIHGEQPLYRVAGESDG